MPVLSPPQGARVFPFAPLFLLLNPLGHFVISSLSVLIGFLARFFLYSLDASDFLFFFAMAFGGWSVNHLCSCGISLATSGM